MAERFDVVVLGTGSAATAAATRCRRAGLSVAVVDERPYGGTCPLRGCDPKKVLWTAAQAADLAARLAPAGLAGAPSIDWGRLMAFKRSFTAPVPEARERRFREAGIATLHGRAEFVGARTVKAGDRVLAGRHVVVATGARPRPLSLEGAERIVTSDVFLDIDQLPRRIVFVGGGYVSFELAHIARRAGAEPVILHRSDHPLKAFDHDLVHGLVEASREAGIAVHLGMEVEAIEGRPDGVAVRAGGRRFEADMAVHGAGREPDVARLRPEVAGLATEKGRLVLDESLRSVSDPGVLAAGDAAGMGPPLTPVAARDGAAVAETIVSGRPRRPDYRGVASAVFAIPPLAAVGMTEEEARRSGLDVEVRHADTGGWFEARRQRAAASAYKIILDRRDGRLLGAHLLGPDAHETINLFALAMRADLPAEALSGMVAAYPSAASGLGHMLGE